MSGKERLDRPVRIVNCSGFFGDRMDALAELVRNDDFDFVTGDYLAEVTMLVLAKNRMKDPQAGYAASFLQQIDPVLALIAERGIRVVVNAGGLNPGALAARVRELCADRGLALSVAHIEGDDLIGRLDELQGDGHTLAHLDTGAPLSTWEYKPLTANAYLGGWGIVAALDAGADIIICPRVADASLVAGAAAWWHRWPVDAWDALAGAVVAGHVIECGTQATGGNYSGFRQIDSIGRPGFPVVEIAADGTSTITKQRGSSGRVTIGTVTAQLVYEIQGLDYLNPDVTTHLDTIVLTAGGEDRVRISDVRGGPPPVTTKVSMTALGGYRNAAYFVLTGLDIDEKAAMVETEIRRRLAGRTGVTAITFDRIGRPADTPARQSDASILLRVCIRGIDESLIGRGFFDIVVEQALASYPGLFTISEDSRNARRYGVYWPAVVAQNTLSHRVILSDGRSLGVPLPPMTNDHPVRVPPAPLPPADWGSTSARPVGSLFDARSGDKGGNANVGLWASSPEAYRWLVDNLDVATLRRMVPELAGLVVERYELPRINAMNFVIYQWLDDGATETMRFDAQAKALGEYIRALKMNLPDRLSRPI